MIHVDFDPQKLAGPEKVWWDAWTARAKEATVDIIAKWERSRRLQSDDFDATVWSDLKVWLLANIFDGKCAYCETHIAMARQPGHAEHFRPKRGVRNRDTASKNKFVRQKTSDETGKTIDHPGYFWLAYSWSNLLPCCIDCNTGRGKNSQFPVGKKHVFLKILSEEAVAALRSKSEAIKSETWPGVYYLAPDDLDDEEGRLLLHPYFDWPREHIRFGFRGIETPIQVNGVPSMKGEESIKVYELYNDNLRRARQQAQDLAAGKYLTAYQHALNAEGKSPEDARNFARETLAKSLGKNPAFFAAIDDYVKQL